MSWQRVRSEFEALLGQPAERVQQRLRELAAADAWLADQLRELLQHDAAAGGWLERTPAAPATMAAGQRLGRYRLLRPLGSGGMGAVWEAEQSDPHRKVAVKMLAGSTRSAAERWRFQQEVQVLAALQHPAIATFFEAGSDRFDGVVVDWLAMELVDGAADLLAWADAARLPRDERLALFVRLCEAVAHGHRHGVLHRDLKPGNVLVGRDGQLKLIDFGVARALGAGAADVATRTGEVLGTLQFMAPEQLRGQPAAIGVASDVYALGGILYHLLCGAPPFPFAGRSFAEIARLVLESEPVPPRSVRRDLPLDLEHIVLHALEKDVRRRYATVDALVDDLQRHRDHLPVKARPASAGDRLRKFVRRHRVAVAIAVALGAGSAAGGYGLWRGREQARAAEQVAIAGREAARQGEAAVAQAADLSREVLRVTVGLFEGIDETAAGRDVTVRELLDAAVIDERATREPRIEQAVRDVRGDAYSRIGRYAEARHELERAVALERDVVVAELVPEDAAATAGRAATRAAQLGRVLVRLGERERGEAMLRDAVDSAAAAGEAAQRRVLQIYCHWLGEENLDRELVEVARQLQELADHSGDRVALFMAQRWLAKACGSLQQHAEAKAAAQAAWELAKAVFGPEHKQTCTAFGAFVTAFHEAGDLDTAARFYPELIDQVRRVYGQTHDHLLTTLNNHAHLLHTQGRRDEALAALRGVVAVHRARGGSMTVPHLQALHNLGQVLNMAGRLEEAEPLLREAANASRTLLGPQDCDGAKMRFNHGACLAWSRRFEEAEPVLLAEYETLVRLLPAGHDVLAKSRRTIAEAYRVNGKPEQAARWRSP